ncbi:MAG: glycosyltransferase, partial [bacterium]|nr:glycosyltransferase [bacterium]
MKILLVNKFWYPKGGSERYTFALKDLLESRGHEVIPFAMEDERNLSTPWAAHFVSHVDYWEAADAVPDQTSMLGKLSRIVWSREAVQKLEALIAETKPDVAHLQNFAHQISPSILPVLARHGIPVVWTLHDYKALCPNYRMYTKGLPCERCKGHSYANAIRYRCMGSVGASAAVALEMYLHHVILNVYGKHLSAVIAPSEFLATKLKEWGWKGRVEVVPNFVGVSTPSRSPSPGEGEKKTVLFVGRLMEEKGIEDFVEAARRLPEIPFAVVGDGPLRSKFQNPESRIQNLTL